MKKKTFLVVFEGLLFGEKIIFKKKQTQALNVEKNSDTIIFFNSPHKK